MEATVKEIIYEREEGLSSLDKGKSGEGEKSLL